jgi:hypothetical protein
VLNVREEGELAMLDLSSGDLTFILASGSAWNPDGRAQKSSHGVGLGYLLVDGDEQVDPHLRRML